MLRAPILYSIRNNFGLERTIVLFPLWITLTQVKRAAEAARRLNESLLARGLTKEGQETTGVSHEAVVDINDSSQRRYILHSGTLRSYESQFGVAIVPRGRYYAPDEKPDLADFRGPDSEKPLFLLITGSDAGAVQSAKEALEEAASGVTPVLRSSHPGLGSEGHKRDRLYEKIVTNMDFETAGRPFRLIERLKGPDLSYIKYIEQETNCRVYLRGKGADRNSAAANNATTEEPLYFHIQATDERSMQEAKALVEDLLDAIRLEYEKACASHVAAIQAYQNQALIADPYLLGVENNIGNFSSLAPFGAPYSANHSFLGTTAVNGTTHLEDSLPPPPPPPPPPLVEDTQFPPPPPPPPPPTFHETNEWSKDFVGDPLSSLPRNVSMHETSSDLESYHAVPPPPPSKISKSSHSHRRR
ncbi:Protein RIK [Galdieria sulphuraria]|nr:Protein RIK [Galdieria sulphuraria]